MHDARREQVLDEAIAAGKFPSSRRTHYRQMYDRDPAGTEQVIRLLATGLPASTVAGLSLADEPYPPGLFPELVHRRRRTPSALGQPGLASSPVTAALSAMPRSDAEVLDAHQVDAWTAALFPEVRATHDGGQAPRVTRADD